MKRIKLQTNFKLLFLIIIFCRANFNSAGQSTFYKQYGPSGGGNIVIKTSDSCYLISGSFGSNTTTLLKINHFGDTLWTAIYNGVIPIIDTDVNETNDNGYIFVGSLYNSSANDALLVKVDSVGNILWNKKIGRINANYEDHFSRVFQTYDNGFILEGNSFDTGLGTPSCSHYVIRTDSSGSVLWTKLYNGIETNYHKGNLTSDSGYVFTGSRFLGLDGIIFIKIDSVGTILINKVYGVFGDYSKQVSQTLDGGYIIMGNNAAQNTILIKTDNMGNIQWAKKYINTAYGFDGYSVIQTSDSGFALICNTSGGLWPKKMVCLKTDSLGNVLWSKCYDGFGYSIVQANDNGYIISGSDNNMSTKLLIKTDQFGNVGCFDSTFVILDSTFQLVVNSFGVSTSSDFVSSTVNLSRGYYMDTVVTSCFTSGINEQSLNHEISYYPNPTTDIISFNKENIIAEIYDLTGRKLLHQKIKGKQISLKHFANGIYILKVRDGSKEQVIKIVRK